MSFLGTLLCQRVPSADTVSWRLPKPFTVALPLVPTM